MRAAAGTSKDDSRRPHQGRPPPNPPDRSPRARGGSRLLAVIAIALVVIAAGCDFQGTWAAPVTLPPPQGAVPQADLHAVSCAPSGVCVAAGTTAFGWDGTVWNPLPDPPAPVTAIACTSGTDCLAADGNAVHHFDGTTWTPTPWPADATPTGISCAAPTMCVIVGARPTGPESRRWNGTTLTALTFASAPVHPHSVSCPTTTFCLAVGAGADGAGPWAGTWTGSTTWTGQPTSALTSPLDRVGCQSPTACTISVTPSLSFQLATWDGTQVTGDAGKTPQAPVSGWYHLACAADSSPTCLASDQGSTSGDRGAAVRGTVPGLSAGPGADVHDLACATSTDCVAIGAAAGTGRIRMAWHLKNGTWSTDTFAGPFAGRPRTDLLSCPTTTFCMAVGTHDLGTWNAPHVSVWDGTTWRTTTQPPAYVPSTSIPTGLTCTSSTWCVMTVKVFEYQSVFGSSWTDLRTWDGTSWLNRRVDFLYDGIVSCPAAESCVGLALRPAQRFTWDGSNLTTTPLPTALPDRPNSLSCVTGTRCAAAVGGHLIPSDQVVTLLDGVVTVTDPPVPAGRVLYLSQVSCAGATSTFCVAVGATAPTGSTDPTQTIPYIIQYDEATGWTVPPLPVAGPGTLTGVSCADSLECLAIGTAAVGAAPAAPVTLAVIGRTWKLAPGPPTAAAGPVTWTDISCLPQWCTALGSTSTGSGTVVASAYTWTNANQSAG